MKFCTSCGQGVNIAIPDGDNRERHVCGDCGTIHYQNPKIVAGCLAFHEDRVLLCRRAIAPREGYWTLPGGFLENGETIEEGATRETLEEANARILEPALYTIFNLPHISQIHMFYLARLADTDFSAGAESLDVALFAETEIPWDEMAFPVNNRTLEHFFADRRRGEYPVRVEDIRRRPRSLD